MLPRAALTLVAFVLLLAGCHRASVERRHYNPGDLLKRDGTLAFCDGSSYFVFSSDGTFQSVPVGESGRMLEGRWTSSTSVDIVTFTVVAKLGWMNGAVSNIPAYYRIVFRVDSGGDVVPFPSPSFSMLKVKKLYQGYWNIEEFTKVSKPE